jgi:hypothetical protein
MAATALCQSNISHRDHEMKILILSGTTRPQYSTHKNHALYAARHGYDYIFDIGPYTDLPSPFFHKVAAIQHHLPNYDWVFWLDDDAAFTRPDTSLEHLVPEMGGNPTAIFCKSPINRGSWTYLSAGNFLTRRCDQAMVGLAAVLRTNLKDVHPWWDPDKLGSFTNGDQDAIVYQILHGNFGEVLRLEYQRFNTRPFHFENQADEHFLVHFTGWPGMTKQQQMSVFCEKFHVEGGLYPLSKIQIALNRVFPRLAQRKTTKNRFGVV